MWIFFRTLQGLYRERQNRQGYHRFQLPFWERTPQTNNPTERLIPPKDPLFGALGRAITN